MCGIIGYVGDRKTVDVLTEGLKSLEYRGYDSSGMTIINSNGEKQTIKGVGRVSELENIIKITSCENATMGIAHNRWATHGGVSENNSHPHSVNNVTLVHNGIIENFVELKKDLIEKGYKFNSETDTEVACALIDSFYDGTNPVDAIERASKLIKGSYAFAIIFNNDKENIYATRKESPLKIGIGDHENFIASDIPAFLRYTKSYFDVEDYEIIKVNKNETVVYYKGHVIDKKVEVSTWNIESAEKQGYDHFMMKEIAEQGHILSLLNDKYLHEDNFSSDVLDLSKYERVDIVACGSAYHAGLVGKYLMEQYAGSIDGKLFIASEVASEYRYKRHYYDDKTLVIVVSQSGETADTLASLRMAKDNGVDTLAIVNVPSSTIAKEAKYVMPMLANLEICVATTKGYFSQVYILSLLALKLGEYKNAIRPEMRKEIILELKNLRESIEELIKKEDHKRIAESIYEKEDIYFIGRGLDYYSSLEASLKLKEISYIHSDTYQAGELKHGPIALIEKGTPLFTTLTQAHLKDKTVSNMLEAKARGAHIILITTSEMGVDNSAYDDIIIIPNASEFNQVLISIIPFQILSYEIAKKRNCDIDKPRNLAKSVTVE